MKFETDIVRLLEVFAVTGCVSIAIVGASLGIGIGYLLVRAAQAVLS